jgi:hypothetical protein
MTRQLGDRRARIRLEVVGSLWGALDFEDTARVVNVSDTGLLIAARTPPLLDAVHPIRLLQDGQEVTVMARVRHFRQAPGPGGSSEYLVGLEVLNGSAVAS